MKRKNCSIFMKSLASEVQMSRFESIKKECFWDYDITASMIENILISGSKVEKQKLFNKIIYNSKDKLSDLSLFNPTDIENFFKDLKITYNKKYLSRQVMILRALLLDEEINIKGLEWKKR